MSAESIAELGNTLWWVRQFRASEQAYDRVVTLVPDQPMLKVQKAFIEAMRSGDDTQLQSALATIPTSMSNDVGVQSWRLRFALNRRDWRQAKEIIKETTIAYNLEHTGNKAIVTNYTFHIFNRLFLDPWGLSIRI